MKNITYLTIDFYSCSTEISINDIVLNRQNVVNLASAAIPIEEYLINGKNNLTVKLRPIKNGVFNTSSKVIVRIATFKEGSILSPENGLTLAEINIQVTEQEQPFKQEYIKNVNFDVKTENKWVWESASILSLDMKGLDKAHTFIKQVHKLIKNKNSDILSKLLMINNKELAVCYPAMTYENRMLAFINYVSSKEKIFNPMDIDEDNIGYRLSANGRLIECIGKDTLPIIRSHSDESKFSENEVSRKLPMHIGLINDQFHILRQ